MSMSAASPRSAPDRGSNKLNSGARGTLKKWPLIYGSRLEVCRQVFTHQKSFGVFTAKNGVSRLHRDGVLEAAVPVEKAKFI
jgi:hypothetical protein